MISCNQLSSSIDNLLYSDFWPGQFFINGYPVLNIFWNLFLLIIPFWLGAGLAIYWRKNKFKKIYQKILAIILGFLWLLFIPNTAYIITDVRHLLDYCPRNYYQRVCPEGAWMIIFFFIYASIGWVAFVFLLNQMKRVIKNIFGKNISRIYIWLIIPLISLGVLLGLINRWNSWEFPLCPWPIFQNILMYITNINYFRNWLVFTIALYILYFAGNFLFKERVSKQTKVKSK